MDKLNSKQRAALDESMTQTPGCCVGFTAKVRNNTDKKVVKKKKEDLDKQSYE